MCLEVGTLFKIQISLVAFLIEEDTELQRTAAISDHLIKTLTGFLVKSDLDDSSYALMREVCSQTKERFSKCNYRNLTNYLVGGGGYAQKNWVGVCGPLP